VRNVAYVETERWERERQGEAERETGRGREREREREGGKETLDIPADRTWTAANTCLIVFIDRFTGTRVRGWRESMCTLGITVP